ncbi:MAG: NADPH:quinone reductase [Vicinamibacterales bacterium]
MKAIRVHEFGGPSVLRLEEVPDPPTPAAGQVLVGVRAAGVNPVDTYVRSGAYGSKPSLPYIPGCDGAGEVLAVGGGVRAVRPGDRVYFSRTVAGTSGAYAEMAICAEDQLHRLPERLSFAQGAGVGIPYGTAYQALVFRGHAVPGEIVLVHGASGGVGVAAVQVAVAYGLQVIGTAGTDRGLDLVRQQGASTVFNHKAAGYTDHILEWTGGRGVDLVVEMLANVNLARDLTLLAPRGRVVVVGSRGTIEINPREAMTREATIVGMRLFNATDAELKAVYAAVACGLANGTFTPVVGREFPLAEAGLAHEAVLAPGSYGKIVLTV